MAIQIIQGKIDTDPFQDMGGAKYTKISMTEAEANMASGMSISLGRIKPASEQIDNGEYKPDIYTKPVSLFERRNKGKVEYRSPNQSSAQSRPMTLTQHPRIVDDTDMSSNAKVLGSVDEMCDAIDRSAAKRICAVEMALTLQMNNHDKLTPTDLAHCDKFDEMYENTNDARHLFDKYSLLEKHITHLECDIENEYFLPSIPDELIHLVLSKGSVTVGGDTKELVSSLNSRTKLLMWLSSYPTKTWKRYLSV